MQNTQVELALQNLLRALRDTKATLNDYRDVTGRIWDIYDDETRMWK